MIKKDEIKRTPSKSDPSDLWPLRHLIRVMRRHLYNLIKDQWLRQDKDKYKDHDKDMTWLVNLLTFHPAPEGTLGRKKRPRQVSYLFGKVLMSTFRKVWFRNIWPSSFWLNCIFVLFWWIFTQPYFSLHTMVLFCGFGAIFWVLLGWGMSMGQFWYSKLFAFLHFFAFVCRFLALFWF